MPCNFCATCWAFGATQMLSVAEDLDNFRERHMLDNDDGASTFD